MNFSQSIRQSRERGFTLVEAVIGLMILVLAASVIFFALSQMNRLASIARLYTAAQFIVQTNIDTLQNDTPFIPQDSQIPTELAVGTTSSNNIQVYVDPSTSNTVVSGTLTTTISNISNATLSEYAYLATVKLAYTYRSTSYQVIESTIRGSDQ